MFNKKGFTLVEMMVAMAIFVTFTTVLIGSYTNIVRSQREANEYRVMYVEARRVFETIVQELRDGMVDYAHYSSGALSGAQKELFLVSRDAMAKSQIVFNEDTGVVQLSKGKLFSNQVPGQDPTILNPVSLNSEVKVKNFRVYVSPVIDPYDQQYAAYDLNQFHPKVTVYAEFERELSNGKTYTMDLQTTVSSRIYNQVYKK